MNPWALDVASPFDGFEADFDLAITFSTGSVDVGEHWCGAALNGVKKSRAESAKGAKGSFRGEY